MILEELRLSDHPAADELYLRIRRRLPRISLGTVYRNLELLAAGGVVQKLQYGGGQKRFDPDPSPHSHFWCTCCMRVEDTPFDLRVPDLDRSHPWVRERVIQGGRPEYYGLCPRCREAGRAP